MDRTLITPWKPSKAEILAARNRHIPDLAAKNLIVLFVGVNPGLYTAAIGRHFGRPGNRFWPALHGGGFTPRLFSPFEDSLLLDLNFGITNIVERATARADELTDDELRAGGRRLEAKVRSWRPTVVAFVGIHPYRVVSGIKDARVGLQKPLFGDTAERYRTEREVGEAMQEVFKGGKIKREDVFVITKLWNTNHRPERVKPACEASLKKLQLDFVDLYLIYTPFAFQPGEEQDPRDANGNVIYDQGVTLLDTWRALEGLVSEGKCKAIGFIRRQPAQVLLAWAIQRGTAPLTTSKTPSRIRENFDVSAIPEDAVREISDGIKSRVRFNAVVKTVFPGSFREKSDLAPLVVLFSPFGLPTAHLCLTARSGEVPIPNPRAMS